MEGGLQAASGDVCITVGCADIFVAEHLLDEAEVGPVFEKMRRKRVAQGVGRNRFADAGGLSIRLDPRPNGHPVDRLAPRCCEERSVLFWRFASKMDKEGVDRQGRGLSDRNHPLLLSFAMHFDKVFVEIGNPELAKLGDSHSGGVEKLQDRLVAGADKILGLGLREERVDLLNGQHVGNELPSFRRVEIPSQIDVNDPLFFQKAEKHLHRGKSPAKRGASKTSIFQMA
jgi:hypothetical protein